MMQRVDPGNAATYMITDYHAGTLTVVNADQKVKTVIPRPARPMWRWASARRATGCAPACQTSRARRAPCGRRRIPTSAPARSVTPMTA
ncbi:hypothetical protein RAA17_20895 [Komagataeibacter rhaeticus]|nr:hypothetical protein [Komagataeibacter rhaeticus]